MENVPMSDGHFVSFLHQNYTDFFTNVYDLQSAAEMLSHSDLFFKEWTVSHIQSNVKSAF